MSSGWCCSYVGLLVVRLLLLIGLLVIRLLLLLTLLLVAGLTELMDVWLPTLIRLLLVVRLLITSTKSLLLRGNLFGVLMMC